MKFNEKYEQIQRQSDFHKIFKAFQEEVKQLISEASHTVSYQLAYDHVFKLTKMGKHSEILQLLDTSIVDLLQSKLMKSQQIDLKLLRKDIENVRQVCQRMTEICLFLDMNYCQKVLKEPLIKRLNRNVFKTLVQCNKVMQLIAMKAFESRQENSKEFETTFTMLQQLDEKRQFFQVFLIPFYTPLVKNFFQKQASNKWQSMKKEQYIQWCRSQLEKQQKFVWQNLAKKQNKEGVQVIVAVIYEKIVGFYKQKLYEESEEVIFQELTVPLLELFKFGKGKQVQSHIQWFMNVLEKKLNKISTQDNNKFIETFCNLYYRVGTLLKKTQSKFQINYRAIFSFQEWINNQKFNIPLRLNIFISDTFLQEQNTDENFVRNVALVFRFVKQKNIFQNIYRRMLVNRIVLSYLSYDVGKEQQIIEGMQKECGEEWSLKIKSISSLFVKDRISIMKQRGISQTSTAQYFKMGGLVPVIIPQDAWPFEDRNSKIQLHSSLMHLTQKFQKNYLQETMKHKLWWTSKAGTVILQIRFNKGRRSFLVSVDMANLLLYLGKEKKKLSYFICEHGYSIDQVETFLQTLINNKLIVSEQEGSDNQVSIAEDFQPGELFDLTQEREKKVEVKVMEQLKADRKLMVEAILVKIMKGEKLCKREQLVQKSAPLVTQRGFKFNVEFVNKSVDRLIDKEFIRDFEDGTVGYIA